MNYKHKLIVVTPAGRKKYLNLLVPRIVNDPSISEWHLWDNCRTEDDRAYIQALAKQHQKIKIIREERVDGSNSSINSFYKFASNLDAFYFKVDDDVLYIKPGTFDRIYQTALATKDDFVWWSAVVVNNAICSWILKYKSRINILQNISAQANDLVGWRSPYFANSLHSFFLNELKNENLSAFEVGNTEIAGGRFSINFIGFFGSEVSKDVAQFCPLGVDDEEWISAVLPCLRGKKGLVVGDTLVSHFSYFTQERYLLRSGMLERYYEQLATLPYEKKFSSSVRRRSVKQFISEALLRILIFRSTSKQLAAITLKADES